jgi:hypothetical protein
MRALVPQGVPVVSTGAVDFMRASGPYEIGRVADMLEVRGRLVVLDRLADPHVIVFNLASGEPVQRLGRTGGGPGEIGAPGTVRRRVGENDTVQVFDMRARRLALYTLDGDTLKFERHEQVPIDVLATDALPLQGGFGYIGILPDAAVYVVNEGRSGASRAVPYLKLGDPPSAISDDGGLPTASRPWATTDPAGERIAFARLDRSQMQFFQTDGTHFVQVTDTVAVRPPNANETTRRVKKVVGLAATDELVLALFCGCRGPTDLPREVLVYGWDGALKGVLVLDQEVFSIAVSGDGRRLYGGIEEPVPMIGVWEIPEAW